MNIVLCTKEDFNQIISNFTYFWGEGSDDRLRRLKHQHHPILIYEFGDNAFVIKEGDKVIAYLFGFYSSVEPVAYVHLVAVHRDHRKKGLAKQLYNHFIEEAKHYQKKISKSDNSSE